MEMERRMAEVQTWAEAVQFCAWAELDAAEVEQREMEREGDDGVVVGCVVGVDRPYVWRRP